MKLIIPEFQLDRYQILIHYLTAISALSTLRKRNSLKPLCTLRGEQASTDPQLSVGYIVTIGKVVEAGQCSKEIGFEPLNPEPISIT